VNVVIVDAVPELTVTGAPMFVPPTSNCTVPAALELSAAITVAVRVTVAPVATGFGAATSDVVVLTAAGAAKADAGGQHRRTSSDSGQSEDDQPDAVSPN